MPTTTSAAPSAKGPLTKAERDQLTATEIKSRLLEGNARFRSGQESEELLLEAIKSEAGQNPEAVILECIDSRVGSEIIFDAGLGSIFTARVAGNVVGPDVIGSLEFSCLEAGSKLIIVLGHSNCGAVKGAINNVQLGELTGLLAKIKPAITDVTTEGRLTPGSPEFATAVAKRNAENSVREIRRQSPPLANAEKSGTVAIIGGFYDLTSRKVEFFEVP